MKKYLLLGAIVILALPAHAQQPANNNDDFVTALTNENITAFLEEVKNISIGNKPDMTDEDVLEYFKNHLAEKGAFHSKMRYEIPGFPMQESEMKLTKSEFIENIMGGRNALKDYTATMEVKELKIHGGKKTATIETLSSEKGYMPFPGEKKGEKEMIPIEGESTCTQKIIVSLNNFIQMANADCATVIRFSPFHDKPLGESFP